MSDDWFNLKITRALMAPQKDPDCFRPGASWFDWFDVSLKELENAVGGGALENHA